MISAFRLEKREDFDHIPLIHHSYDPPKTDEMALHVPRAPGFASMLKDGAQFFSGVEEAVVRNIGACREFAATVQSAYGPNGMNKVCVLKEYPPCPLSF